MDVPISKSRRRRQPLIFAAVATAIVVASIGAASRLKPAAPEVEKSTLLIDTVRRGPMMRAVHGSGSLVPESQRIVSALTAGRVERIHARAGTSVQAGELLVELSNPDVQLSALDAERQLKLAEAELASLEAGLENSKLAQQSTVAAARTSLHEAERGLAAAEQLAKEGLNSSMEVERARDAAQEARDRHAAETRRLELADQTLSVQLALRRADVERLRAIARFERERVESMRVTAASAGVVQELSLDPGQWLQSGQLIARIAAPDRLKAVLRIPETQARDLAIGLPVVVDTRDGKVRGRVARIDPAVQSGTIAVDVTLEGRLPRGARPDLTVDGTIELERLADVMATGRPAAGNGESTTYLFRVEPDGNAAIRVPVRLGRTSATEVEIVSGLAVGDRVILSDMSQWDHVNRVRLRR